MAHIALAIVSATLAIVFILLAIYIIMLKYPGVCSTGCGRAPSFMDGPLCLSVLEKYADPTIATPTPQPYITNFTATSGAGPPFCAPTWYAFRYVRNADGGYSSMSPWSGYTSADPTNPIPIFAGSATFPTPPGQTPNFPTGSASCTFNMPTIALTAPLDFAISYMQPNGYSLNVHRQVGYIDQSGNPQGFDPSSEGVVVGSFMVGPPGSSPVATFIDAAFNPKSTTQPRCC